MTVFWSPKDVPELADLPVLARWRAWLACWHKPWRHGEVWMAFLAAIAPLFTLALTERLLRRNLFEALGSSAGVWVPLGVLLVLLPGLAVFGRTQNEFVRPYIREYLAKNTSSVSPL
jgi:hypothetical protein